MTPREIRLNDLSIQWVNDYWDGPLSGMGMIDGELVYFQCEDQDDELNRSYGIYRLTAEQLAQEEERHADFNRLVGTYWDWSLPASLRSYKPRDTHGEFYEKHPPFRQEHDLSLAIKIGVAK
jgi:hypothetical protein